jgi:RNA 3'-terminal phosphate cyclase (ATP)
MLVINGAQGEGGGQILRTALTLSAILSQPIRIENIRANRKTPGLAAQHLTAVRAAAMICDARLTGDALGSTRLTFEPQTPPIPGIYEFDVADNSAAGSAGAATLVCQTILLPLALAHNSSTVTVKGGTHVPFSPPFHFFDQVYLPALAALGVQAAAELPAWGWYPAGGGEISLTIPGSNVLNCLTGQDMPRGALTQVTGIAVASSLPAHIAQRICNRAVNLLKQAGLPAAIDPLRVRSVSPGAGIFLTAHYQGGRAGFSVLGHKGKPSEQVAEEAVNNLLAYHHGQGGMDVHLADQLILPLALTGQPYTMRSGPLSLHTLTNIGVVEQFLGPITEIDHDRGLVFFRPE